MEAHRLNKDLLSTATTQIWRIVSGPLLLMFIPWYLSSAEQGYWYTFLSMGALSIFADLGFSNIILQFSAHEFAKLHFTDTREISGDEDNLNRLASFFRFSVKWLFKVCVLVFPLIIAGGFVFINSKSIEGIDWKNPWILYSINTVVFFLYSSILCFFEGCNSVSSVQLIRLRVGIVNSCIILISLYSGMKLYSLTIALFITNFVGLYLLYKHFSVPMKQLWDISKTATYDWWPEFSSLIWRYAISWMSGYFVFQLFTPIAFQFYGVEAAGKVGLSIAAWTAGYNIASVWIISIIPKINMLVSDKKWTELNELFNRRLKYAVLTMLSGGIGFFLLYFIFYGKIQVFNRMLSFEGMLILFFCWLFQVYINARAIYLRAYRKEPLMQLSVFSAIYISISTYFLARYFAVDYMFLGFLSSFLVGIPVTYRIYKQYVKEYNNQRLL